MCEAKYNTSLNALIAMLAKKARGDAERGLAYEIENKVRLARRNTTKPPVARSLKFFLKYNDDIVSRNETALFSYDFTAELLAESPTGKLDEEDHLIISLFNLIRTVYGRCNTTDKDRAYALLTDLHTASLEYGEAQQEAD